VLTGDELDGPRGRIYLIKDMLENDRPASAEVVKHIDRCLSCLACMTTCPSGVHYMHLIDHARHHIERTYRRPFGERLLRALLAKVMPDLKWFSRFLFAGSLVRPLAGILAALGLRRLAAMLRLTPTRPPPRAGRSLGRVPAEGTRKGRVILMRGCVNDAVAPAINAAAIRLLARHGVEVVLPSAEGCCGGIVHHMGKAEQALAHARRNIDAWAAEIAQGVDAILMTASGCGTTLKDFGFMLRTDPRYSQEAAAVSALARDVSEYLVKIGLPQAPSNGLRVAYHCPCSLQHGQRITREPKTLLAQAGFTVLDVPEGHQCCGSAGTYNMLQPEFARAFARRKAAHIERVRPDIIATSNLGCMVQIAQETAIPIFHVVELLDWATGGPSPQGLQRVPIESQMIRRLRTEEGTKMRSEAAA
jgi:glycolate oxidase iron-sulfur subunit